MRQFRKNFSKDKDKKRKAKRLEPESEVRELEEQLATASNDQLTNDYNKCTHATWYEKGEKSIKYVLNLEKRTKQSHTLEKSLIPMVLKKTTQKIFWLTLSPFIQNCIADVA